MSEELVISGGGDVGPGRTEEVRMYGNEHPSISTFDMEPVLKDAIQTWGEQAQVLKAIEELCELAAVLSKFVNCDSMLRPRVIDEIADSYVMLTQLREMFGRAEVDEKVIEKTIKLAEKLKREHEQR